MKLVRKVLAVASSVGIGLLGAVALADDDAHHRGARRFEVTITNLTRGQQFTPILVATHRSSVNIFNLGSPATSELATLAEEGDTSALSALLLTNPDVKDVAVGSGLTNPGQSTTVVVETRGAFDHVSVAAMLIPTNDAFMALNNVKGPDGRRAITVFSPAYDAGSEMNDELCASIPGPFFVECGGAGQGDKVGGGEGYVHIHAGIHGGGNLNAAERDWRNPVAKVTVRRVP